MKFNNFKVINSNTIIRDLEEENKKLKNKIKVLQSKVKTYEADINKKYNIPIVKTDEAVNEIMDDMLSIENPKAIK